MLKPMKDNKKKSKQTTKKREKLEWLGLIAFIAILYFTGWYKPIMSGAQRALLWTSILNPKVEQAANADAQTLPEGAYNTVLTQPNGDPVQLKKFKGNVLFINVWASWCPPCVAEMPTIETLYNHVSDNENIKFLLISLDRKPEKARAFMEKHGFPMPYYFPNGRMPDFLNSSVIPATYVISKDGKMIYKRDGISNYSSDSFRKWLLKQAGL